MRIATLIATLSVYEVAFPVRIVINRVPQCNEENKTPRPASAPTSA